MAKCTVILGGLSLAALLLAACGGGKAEPTPSPSPAVAQPSPTPEPRSEPTVEPTPTVEKPDLLTLMPAAHVLDQSLDVSLDGSETGQIVVISHTIRIDKQGQRAVATVPEECPDNTVLLGDPSPCAFRVEVFTYDPASGWTSKFLQDGDDPVSEGGYVLPGITQGVQARAFATGEDGLQGLLVTYVKCTASNCPVEHHLVLAMKDSVITEVYNAFKASVQIEGNSATFSMPFYAQGALLYGACCPNGRLIQTVAINPESRDIGIIAAELDICTEGNIITAPVEPPNLLFVRCLDPDDPAYSPPRHVGGFETTEQTVVEPTAVGELQGLAEGDRVRVEFTVKECPQSLLDCSPDSITLVATKITRLAP